MARIRAASRLRRVLLLNRVTAIKIWGVNGDNPEYAWAGALKNRDGRFESRLDSTLNPRVRYGEVFSCEEDAGVRDGMRPREGFLQLGMLTGREIRKRPTLESTLPRPRLMYDFVDFLGQMRMNSAQSIEHDALLLGLWQRVKRASVLLPDVCRR